MNKTLIKLTRNNSKNNSKNKKPRKLSRNRNVNKWETLEHNGLLFPPEYVPHTKPLKYNDKLVELNPLAEEAAMIYVKYFGTEYIENKTFNRNFFNSWKKLLGKDSIIQQLDLCDFTEYREIYDNLKNIRKLNIKPEIDPEKEKKYKTALVDGKIQPVGNYRMEPPGLFLGRGDNPNIGKLKSRIYPEDITINISKDAKIPEIPEHLKGHKWGTIVHNRKAEWLASWSDTITGKNKYLWLGAHSDFKSNSDIDKFELARKLKRKIKTIREENELNLVSEDLKTRQIATAFYFIDNFALRVGNEKGEDEADTVGVSSLRVEHIELKEDNKIVLDFLGKDSIRYYNKLQVDSNIYKNMLEFTKDKKKDDQIFDKIISNDINKYLQTFLKNLTAKVFRTYNASYLLQKELKKIRNKYPQNADKTILLDEYNKANAKVAILCNHQKNAGKSSYKDQIGKIDEKLKKIKSKLRKAKKSNGANKNERIEKLKAKLLKIKSKKTLKTELKNISLGTSKVNYIDQRITIAFFKHFDLSLDKVFSKTLMDKFKWAMDVDSEFKF